MLQPHPRNACSTIEPKAMKRIRIKHYAPQTTGHRAFLYTRKPINHIHHGLDSIAVHTKRQRF